MLMHCFAFRIVRVQQFPNNTQEKVRTLISLREVRTKRIREALKRLVEQGFLATDNTDPKTPRYHITQNGIGAIYDVERRFPSNEITKDVYLPVRKTPKQEAPAVIK